MRYKDIHVGDRVVFHAGWALSSMQGQVATVLVRNSEDSIGLLFDDYVAYSHDLGGIGESGRSAWVNACDIKPATEEPVSYTLNPLSELLGGGFI